MIWYNTGPSISFAFGETLFSINCGRNSAVSADCEFARAGLGALYKPWEGSEKTAPISTEGWRAGAWPTAKENPKNTNARTTAWKHDLSGIDVSNVEFQEFTKWKDYRSGCENTRCLRWQ